MTQDDIILWPDGTWCFRHDLHEMDFMSDDYRVVHFSTSEWHDFNKE